MPTRLTKPVHRVTNKMIGKLPIVITISPGTEKRDDLIGLRLLGTRTQYVVTVADLYRIAALWHGQKEAGARRVAHREGEPWKMAKRRFVRDNSIPKPPRKINPPSEEGGETANHNTAQKEKHEHNKDSATTSGQGGP